MSLELLPQRFGSPKWQKSDQFSIKVTEAHIGRMHVELQIRSPRPYHRNAAGGFDDTVIFTYMVLPRRP